LSDWFHVSHFETHQTSRSDGQADRRDLDVALDALVLALNKELSLLVHLHFRLTELRLLLLDGNPGFIQLAAQDVGEATNVIVSHESRTVAAIAAARSALRIDAELLVDIATQAPDSHRKVLLRLASEIDATSRALSVLREAVQRQSATGRQAVSNDLDLTNGATGSKTNQPGHLFRGAF